ncbi:UNVERIFIED_CONTAM: hypothetical protein FKN15_061137 [Acipenser sinensis]
MCTYLGAQSEQLMGGKIKRNLSRPHFPPVRMRDFDCMDFHSGMSYGRPPKIIHLEANFVQFKEDLLPKEDNKALLTFPFLHIYWTDCCDTEIYKATVKEDIIRWQNLLKTYNTVDWLIVVVESDAKKKNKTNILPRTSIVDKIRNDFCNKQSDRCVVLSDPLKDSSRSQESWSAFLTKLRTLLLMSFTKNLGKFEDDMRTLREKRTEPGWSFCEYFMVQEELAFVFEMLQQFEDALVQYDELDALFTQYVVNFGAGAFLNNKIERKALFFPCCTSGCVVLSDPLKDSSRSQESWSAFLTKLRTLLLMSFTKNLGKFEDDMRTLREKRTEPGWSFCEYFMVQEELAFVFEMLQQFEDALVQYDELDALFTQYVVNFGAGDGANWLTSFCQPVHSWNGLVLRKPIDMEKRDLIQKSKATLLDMRSYLFSRQCTLLIFLQRPWEVTQRALELLHNCVQELHLLEVLVLQGALDCWVFLSCLEVLQRIEGCSDRAQLDSNSSHTVGLWTYATEKVNNRARVSTLHATIISMAGITAFRSSEVLKSLGYLCGLASENGPNSEDLNRTVDLLAGLGAEPPETASSLQSPYKKLKEALSSVEAFEKHYLPAESAVVRGLATNYGLPPSSCSIVHTSDGQSRSPRYMVQSGTSTIEHTIKSKVVL